MHAFLLIGQSNMAGRGYLNEAHDIDASHIYILRNGRWQKMFRPVNPDKLHFNAASLYEFGLRYFAAFETLATSQNAGPEVDLQRSQMELL